MRIQYAISLWNFCHYAQVAGLDEELARIRELGYAVELWNHWPGRESLYAKSQRAGLKSALAGMPVSVHTGFAYSLAEQQVQIDAAEELGASVLVVHPDEFFEGGEDGRLDVALCRDVVAYAAARGVRVALENGQLGFLERAITAVDGLKICLDIGHVYKTEDSLEAFLGTLKTRLIHLHFQDILPAPEEDLPHAGVDHYVPGSGSIPEEDWELLATTLQEVDFDGTAVFEIRPRNPYQTARLGSQFLSRFVPQALVPSAPSVPRMPNIP
jgi:sugar phosphate isomerase/epimerase